MVAMVASLLTTWLTPVAAEAAPGVVLSADALALGRALAGDTSWVTGAAFESRAGSTSTALASGGVAGMPTSGAQAALLSTGDATITTAPNSSDSSGADLGGTSVRGDSDFDVTVLRVDLQVPATVNCLVGLDFRFLSEEYPEYVGSRYNDAFIAELDRTTWDTSGSTIAAPDNFAFDPTGSPITVNAAGATSMTTAQAAGTTFDGATPLLTAATPLTPGAHRLYLSIFDQGDHIYDSAVLVDNLRLGTVGNVATECKPGAQVIDKSRYVALGDSYSSGFGVSPYFPGTHKDIGPNDCQRSTRAYGPRVAEAKGLTLDFHACQGALTKDFYTPRNSTWGEPRQLNHLKADTGLVTFSIGGNDAGFADVLAECILGFELLPFNTCYKDEKVLKPVRDAIARLDGRASTPGDITPYNTLYGDVRRASPRATRVAVGYPHFYTASGSDRTFLPGGRCEGVKKADQRWMVEKIDELNGIIERNARRNGLLFANPNPRFNGHELCGGGTEWINGVLSDGKFHPTASGHQAIADAVLAKLADDGFQRFTVLPQKKVTYSFVVGSPKQFISLVTGWPGSDVSLSLVAPSGRRIDRSTHASDVARETQATFEHLEVANPEQGTWTAELFGAYVAAGGEPVTLSIYQGEVPNMAPTGRITTRIEGDSLVLDARGSTDPDGQVVSYDWYVSSADDDKVLQGATVKVPLAGAAERTFTLVVTDNRGATDFQDLAWIPIDVMPGSDVNPINLRSSGVTPIALLSTATFDATKLPPTSLRVGPNNASVKETTPKSEDVNGDGRADQVVHVATKSLGLAAQMTQLCLTGTLPNARTVSSCDRIQIR
jgi:lysophospholipase L1-like esterase